MRCSTWQVVPKQAFKAKVDDAKLAQRRSHASSGRAAFTTREAGSWRGQPYKYRSYRGSSRALCLQPWANNGGGVTTGAAS